MEESKKKIDIHVHGALKRYPVSSGNPHDPESHYVAPHGELRQALTKKNIRRAVLMSSGEYYDPGCNTLGAYNEDCIRICEEEGGYFSWMCNFNPSAPGMLKERVLSCKLNGARGIGEVMVNRWMDDPFLETLFLAAQEYDMPVLCHMSPEPGYSYGVCDRAGLPLLESTLKKYPGMKFIGHSQVFWLEISADCPRHGSRERSGFGHGKVKPGGRLEYLFENYPNLYGDLSANSGYLALKRDEDYAMHFLHRFSKRLMFATDATNWRTIPPLADFLDKCLMEKRLSNEDYERICYKNAEELFKI